MSEVVRVHKECLAAVEAPARAVLSAFEAFQPSIPPLVSDDMTVTFNVSMELGTLRRLAAHLRGHGGHA